MTSDIPRRPLGRTGERVSAIGLGGWHLALPPVPATVPPQDAVTFGVGTLLPGLIVSAAVLAFGEAFGRRNAKT